MDVAKLQAHADGIKSELAHLQLDMRMRNAKDTNAVAKKKQELARVLTVLQEKRLTEKTAAKSSKDSK